MTRRTGHLARGGWWLAALMTLPTCGGSDGASPAVAPANPTWHKDVAPIVMRSCAGCHVEGGIAPFAATTYDKVKPRAGLMLAAIESGAMPPWHAHDTAECKPRFGWQDDLRLSPVQKETFKRWVEQGAPAGDPATAPAGGPVAKVTTLANVTSVARMRAPATVGGTRDQFRCIVIDPQLTEDAWITGIEVRPGNAEVVHHVLVWGDPDRNGQRIAQAGGSEDTYECFGAPGFVAPLLNAWAPGSVPLEMPPDVAMPLRKGSHIVLNMHYHPTGRGDALDQTSVALRYSTTKPGHVGIVYLIGNFNQLDERGFGLQPGAGDPPSGVEFRIPAGAKGHVESLRFEVPAMTAGMPTPDVRLFGVGTHMHYVGTDMKMEVMRTKPAAGEPASECLIQTPAWDFHWQRGYMYDAPLDRVPLLRAGDVLAMRCTYNNSMDNRWVELALRERGLGAPVDVKLGEETLDEMCLGAYVVAMKRADWEKVTGGL